MHHLILTKKAVATKITKSNKIIKSTKTTTKKINIKRSRKTVNPSIIKAKNKNLKSKLTKSSKIFKSISTGRTSKLKMTRKTFMSRRTLIRKKWAKNKRAKRKKTKSKVALDTSLIKRYSQKLNSSLHTEWRRKDTHTNNWKETSFKPSRNSFPFLTSRACL